MFITSRYSGYDDKGQQIAGGYFLMVASDATQKHLYGCVRFVKLHQLGHWMMGCARVANESLTVSGAYGSDGLPMDYERMSDKVKAQFVELNVEDVDAFWHGTGGHNGAGSEASHMQQVGKALLKLRKAKR